jgi:energy-coupling factor transporter ATP-binding protein EcfA2
MFYLITGAAASGKSTMLRNLREILTDVECHDSDEIQYDKNRKEGLDTVEWIERALSAQKKGKDFLLVAHTPLGSLLAAPNSIKLDGISACLLDCNDFVRVDRFKNRHQMEEWPLNQDVICWAVFQRLHAFDPQWEQRIINSNPDYQWERWENWNSDDKRWNVKIIDNSDLSIKETVNALIDWVNAKKKENNYLTVESEWWIN